MMLEFIIFITILGKCVAIAPTLPFNDTCEYSKYGGSQDKCGDQCVKVPDYGFNCQCGSNLIRAKNFGEESWCCIPRDSACSRRESEYEYEYESEGYCSQGVVIPKSSFCPNPDRSKQCYNSYQDSEFISFGSHFTCPRKCIPVQKICQGISWCGSDVKECGPQLRCPEWAAIKNRKHSLYSDLVPDHHTCIKEEEQNDGIFDAFDRSDETKVRTDGLSYDIDITQFSPCEAPSGYDGAVVQSRGNCQTQNIKKLQTLCNAINWLHQKHCISKRPLFQNQQQSSCQL